MSENQEIFDQEEEVEQSRMPMVDEKLMSESEDNYNNDKAIQSKSNDTPANNNDDESDSGPGWIMRYEVSSYLG